MQEAIQAEYNQKKVEDIGVKNTPLESVLLSKQEGIRTQGGLYQLAGIEYPTIGKRRLSGAKKRQ